MKRANVVRRLSALWDIRSVTFAAAMSVSLLAIPIHAHAAGPDQPEGIRMMLKVQIPPDGGNEAIKAGNQGRLISG